LLVLFVGFILMFWASKEQQHAFVDLYILGRGIVQVWPLVLLSAIFAATVAAQFHVYDKKIALLRGELDRVSDEKSKLQQELTTTKLRHGGDD
jgi:hypothetical protein